VGTHFIDAARMLTGRDIRSVSATLDLANRPDCRGPEFRDPGGWALLRMDGGVIVHVHAPDYANAPAEVILHGMLGRARIGEGVAEIETWQGGREKLPDAPADGGTSMDRAVREIVAWLDNGTPVCCAPEESWRTLEVIVACHASHARQATWIDLPLAVAERDREVLSG
jgi:predicted dehydrogenase